MKSQITIIFGVLILILSACITREHVRIYPNHPIKKLSGVCEGVGDSHLIDFVSDKEFKKYRVIVSRNRTILILRTEDDQTEAYLTRTLGPDNAPASKDFKPVDAKAFKETFVLLQPGYGIKLTEIKERGGKYMIKGKSYNAHIKVDDSDWIAFPETATKKSKDMMEKEASYIATLWQHALQKSDMASKCVNYYSVKNDEPFEPCYLDKPECPSDSKCPDMDACEDLYVNYANAEIEEIVITATVYPSYYEPWQHDYLDYLGATVGAHSSTGGAGGGSDDGSTSSSGVSTSDDSYGSGPCDDNLPLEPIPVCNWETSECCGEGEGSTKKVALLMAKHDAHQKCINFPGNKGRKCCGFDKPRYYFEDDLWHAQIKYHVHRDADSSCYY